MNKVIIKVEGKVQGVGLRATIKSIADDLGICGTVENKDDGSVQIVCEAEQSAIAHIPNVGASIHTGTSPTFRWKCQ